VATLLAIFMTSSRKPSFGTSRILVISPALSSSCAVMRSPARIKDAAFCRPMICMNVTLEQASAQRPHFTKGVKKIASGTEYTRSKRDSMLVPYPIAGPLTAAIRIFGVLIKSSCIALVQNQYVASESNGAGLR